MVWRAFATEQRVRAEQREGACFAVQTFPVSGEAVTPIEHAKVRLITQRLGISALSTIQRLCRRADDRQIWIFRRFLSQQKPGHQERRCAWDQKRLKPGLTRRPAGSVDKNRLGIRSKLTYA